MESLSNASTDDPSDSHTPRGAAKEDGRGCSFVPAQGTPGLLPGLGGCGIQCSPRRGNSAQTPASSVLLHIYDVDAYTGWMNWAFLRRADMGVFHVGVEVYGDEYCFQCFEDSWDDCSVSGMQQGMPKQSSEFIYRESVSLGATPFTELEVAEVLVQMYREWPANSYHITKRNCLHFAEELTGRIKTPVPFPEWIHGIVRASNNSATLSGIVDYGWSVSKWWMIQKHNRKRTMGNWLCGDQLCGARSSLRDSEMCLPIEAAGPYMEYSAACEPPTPRIGGAGNHFLGDQALEDPAPFEGERYGTICVENQYNVAL